MLLEFDDGTYKIQFSAHDKAQIIHTQSKQNTTFWQWLRTSGARQLFLSVFRSGWDQNSTILTLCNQRGSLGLSLFKAIKKDSAAGMLVCQRLILPMLKLNWGFNVKREEQLMKQKGLGHSLGLRVIEAYPSKIRLLEDLT